MRSAPRVPSRGFSLVELFVTVMVAAILLAIAFPSFREIQVRNNVTQISNGLIHAINLARAEAARRGTSTEVVSASGSATWSGGWNVLADSNFDGSFATKVGTGSAVGTGYSVCAKSTGGGADSAIVFRQDGTLSGATSFDINVNRPDGNATLSQRITISGSGEVKSKVNTTGSPAAGTCS
jgi:type IV fimbrial biogenesis protein FimT